MAARDQRGTWVQGLRSAARSRMAGLFSAGLLLLLAAAASFHGFYDKWSLHDSSDRSSFRLMIDGDASRPFVYRRLLFDIANALQKATPPKLVAAVERHLREERDAPPFHAKLNLKEGAVDPYLFRYFTVYLLGFASMVAAVWLIAVMIGRRFSPVTGVMVAGAMAILFPILQSKGGYVYDFPELLFLVGAYFVARSRMPLLLIPIAILAMLNKEAFFFFVPALFPLLVARHGWRKGFVFTAVTGVAALGTYALVRAAYAQNAGGAVEQHWIENIPFYLNPLSLLRLEYTYGLPLFAGYSILMLVFVAIILLNGFRFLGQGERWHVWIAALINVPLFLLFCYSGETRNLSLLFPGLIVCAAAAVQRVVSVSAISSVRPDVHG